MGILQSLIKIGVPSSSATILDNYYANLDEGDFLDGINQIASEVVGVSDAKTLQPPRIDPWLAIHTNIAKGGQLPTEALEETIMNFQTDQKSAITDAVVALGNIVRSWYQQQKNQNKHPKYAEIIRALKTLGYYFKLNLCDGDIEVNGDKLENSLSTVIVWKMRDLGFWQRGAIEDAFVAESWYNRYHPVKDYILSLSWDGQPHIEEVANHFQDKDCVFHLWLRRWLLGAIGKALNNDQNRMLVLDGVQGIGKSYFAKWLSDPLEKYFIEAPINTDDKDVFLRLSSKWIWEVSELGSTTRRADREALKAFLTMREITIRRPYDRYDTHKSALASFIGTVNDEGSGILNDPTGNRRFMIAKIIDIDRKYTSLDVNQVWAEAYAAYLAGERGELSDDEKKLAGEINAEYEMEDYLEDAIRKYFVVDPNNKMLWTPYIDIIERLKANGIFWPSTKAAAMQVCATLTKMGHEKSGRAISPGTTKRIRGYIGIGL